MTRDDQPRWPKGTPGGGHGPGPGPGRFRPERGRKRGDWADRLSRRLPEPPPEESYFDRRIREDRARGLTIHTGDDLPADAPPVTQFGRARGDGTYELTAAEMNPIAHLLAGRIEYRHREARGDGTFYVPPWQQADSAQAYSLPADEWGEGGPTIAFGTRPNTGQLFRPESVIEFKPTGGRTHEDEFFDLRAAVGGESEEDAADVGGENYERYIDRFEIQDENGNWSTIRHIEQQDPEDYDGPDDGWGPLRFDTDAGHVLRMPADWYAVDPDWGTVRIRPVTP